MSSYNNICALGDIFPDADADMFEKMECAVKQESTKQDKACQTDELFSVGFDLGTVDLDKVEEMEEDDRESSQSFVLGSPLVLSALGVEGSDDGHDGSSSAYWGNVTDIDAELLDQILPGPEDDGDSTLGGSSVEVVASVGPGKQFVVLPAEERDELKRMVASVEPKLGNAVGLLTDCIISDSGNEMTAMLTGYAVLNRLNGTERKLKITEVGQIPLWSIKTTTLKDEEEGCMARTPKSQPPPPPQRRFTLRRSPDSSYLPDGSRKDEVGWPSMVANADTEETAWHESTLLKRPSRDDDDILLPPKKKLRWSKARTHASSSKRKDISSDDEACWAADESTSHAPKLSRKRQTSGKSKTSNAKAGSSKDTAAEAGPSKRKRV
ncbi:hypothetical protein B0H21DRAFT_713538 [Amylocystis lapponica]|nr:hypothetical protein B0H21DRAFT_713538 [Amylocystis lapponica]